MGYQELSFLEVIATGILNGVLTKDSSGTEYTIESIKIADAGDTGQYVVATTTGEELLRNFNKQYWYKVDSIDVTATLPTIVRGRPITKRDKGK